MLKELNKDMERIKKIMYKQNENNKEEIENPKKKEDKSWNCKLQ